MATVWTQQLDFPYTIILGELSKISEVYNTASFEYIFKVDIHKAPYILQEVIEAKPDSVGSF